MLFTKFTNLVQSTEVSKNLATVSSDGDGGDGDVVSGNGDDGVISKVVSDILLDKLINNIFL